MLKVAVWNHNKVYERTVWKMNSVMTNNLAFLAGDDITCCCSSSDGTVKVIMLYLQYNKKWPWLFSVSGQKATSFFPLWINHYVTVWNLRHPENLIRRKIQFQKQYMLACVRSILARWQWAKQLLHVVSVHNLWVSQNGLKIDGYKIDPEKYQTIDETLICLYKLVGLCYLPAFFLFCGNNEYNILIGLYWSASDHSLSAGPVF